MPLSMKPPKLLFFLLVVLIILIIFVIEDRKVKRNLMFKEPTTVSNRDHLEAKKNKPLIHKGLVLAKRQILKEFKSNFQAKGGVKVFGDTKFGFNVSAEHVHKILIVSQTRSGSSFLGELLNQFPGSYYFFEPLHYYSHHKDQTKHPPFKFLDNLLSCKFAEDGSGFLRHIAEPNNQFMFKHHNSRLWTACSGLLPNHAMCFRPELLNQLCPIFPVRLMKTVRLRIKEAAELLAEDDLMKIILLVRDPRGTHSSRQEESVAVWCNSTRKCSDPTVSCADLEDDIEQAHRLRATHPNSIMILRYEDLCTTTEETVKRLFEFLGLPLVPSVSQYIVSHTRGKTAQNRSVDPYSTVRNSSFVSGAWKENLDFGSVTDIQKACKLPMERLGHKIFDKQGDLSS